MASDDESFLKHLSRYHYLLGGLIALAEFAFFGLIIWNIFSSRKEDGESSGNFLAMIPFFAVMILAALLPFCMILAGWSLAHLRNYKFIFIVACLECLNIPFGTALGVLTIATLMRGPVKGIFNSHSPTPPPIPGAKSEEWEY